MAIRGVGGVSSAARVVAGRDGVGVAERRTSGGCTVDGDVDGLASVVEGVFAGSVGGTQGLRQRKCNVKLQRCG